MTKAQITDHQAPISAIAYSRVSTVDQFEGGHGLHAQRATIETEAARRGWDLTTHYTDAASGKSLEKRPALTDALEVLANGGADALVVAKLDRLSRSLVDFAGLMDKARAEGWALVILDLAVDTTTPHGQLLANIMASIATWERQMISLRTREALQAARRRGVAIGRPRTMSAATVRHIIDRRRNGMTLRAIADELQTLQTPTAHGGDRWHASTVRAVLLAAQEDKENAVTG